MVRFSPKALGEGRGRIVRSLAGAWLNFALGALPGRNPGLKLARNGRVAPTAVTSYVGSRMARRCGRVVPVWRGGELVVAVAWLGGYRVVTKL